MPIASTDLLAPVGELEPALFPTESVPALQQRLDDWLLLAYERATAAGITDQAKADAVATAFASARFYRGALARIIGSPTTTALVDKESHSYSSKQLDLLALRADYWENLYASLIAPAIVLEDPTGAPSGAQPATFRF